MEENRRIVRQERLQKYGRILASRYRLNVELKEGLPGYACTNSTNMILVKPDISKDNFQNLIYQKTMILHEIGHVVFTNSKVWITGPSYVPANFSNIIMDGRVEEAVSRTYPKARLYFIYTNQKLLPIKVSEKSSLEMLLLELIFREAKKTTGIPQLPKTLHDFIQAQIKKEDYQSLLEITRKSIEVKTEQEAYALTQKLYKIVKSYSPSMQVYNNITGTVMDSARKCGASSKVMPDQKPYDKQRVKDLIKTLAQQAGFGKEDKEEVKKEDMPDAKEGDKTEVPETPETPEEPKGEEFDETSQGNESPSTETQGDTNEGPSGGSDSKGKDESLDIDDDLGDSDLGDNIFEDIKDRLHNESLDELKDEAQVISQGEVEKDFSAYDGVTEPWCYDSITPIATTPLESMAVSLCHLFKTIAQRGDGWSRNQLRGKLEMHKLPLLLTKTEQPKIFKKRDKVTQTDLSVVILLDSSGSMGGRSYRATQAAYVIARALERGKYKSEVVQFYGGSDTVTGIKSFNQKLDFAKKDFKPISESQTPLYGALKGAKRSLDRLASKRKMIIVVTDGQPQEEDKCIVKIKEIEKAGIFVIGVLICHSDYYNIFNPKHRLRCDEVNELPIKMSKVIKDVLMTIKRE